MRLLVTGGSGFLGGYVLAEAAPRRRRPSEQRPPRQVRRLAELAPLDISSRTAGQNICVS
jgi:uncharacterized protein YbjT (DUF2867 family)